jgi:SLT domain-containing protein
MDEEIERLLVSVRADTGAFARDVAEMRAQLDGPLSDGISRAGNVLDQALARAIRTGKFGFEDLKRTALGMMSEIALAALRSGIQTGAGGGGSAGIVASLGQILGAVLGAPGRATGGAVTPGRAYMVGERGPEVFVPTSSGRVEAGREGSRDVRISISVNAPSGGEPQALARSSRQVARAVKQALLRVED